MHRYGFKCESKNLLLKFLSAVGLGGAADPTSRISIYKGECIGLVLPIAMVKPIGTNCSLLVQWVYTRNMASFHFEV